VNNWVTNCIDWLGWVNVVIVATHQGRLNDNVASDAASYWSYSYEDNSNYRIIEADSVNSAIDQLNDIQNVDNLSLNVHSDGTDMQLTSSMGDMIDSNAFANLTDSVNWTDPSARDVYLCGCDTDSIASSLSENFSGTISGEGTEIGFSNESILGLETIDGNQIDIPRELSTYKEGELISSQTIPIPE
jgi:hypothetical protein